MRRILVIRGGALGDVILTLPAIGALRQAFPNAHIEVLGASNRLSLALHPAYADTIMDAERLKIYRLFGREVREPSKLALYLRGFDLILSYVPAPNPIFIDNLRRYGSAQVLAWPTHPGSRVHAADHLLQPVLRFVETTPPAEPKVYPGAEHRHAANRFWQSAGLPQRGVLAIHPRQRRASQAVATERLAAGPEKGRKAWGAGDSDLRARGAGAGPQSSTGKSQLRMETAGRHTLVATGGNPGKVRGICGP